MIMAGCVWRLTTEPFQTYHCLYNKAYFGLPLQVEIGETVSALKYARKALTAASAKDASVWGLLALILTAQQKEEIAVAVIEAGLTAVLPQQQISLLRVKAKIHQLQGRHHPPATPECVRPNRSRQLTVGIGKSLLEGAIRLLAQGMAFNSRCSAWRVSKGQVLAAQRH